LKYSLSSPFLSQYHANVFWGSGVLPDPMSVSRSSIHDFRNARFFLTVMALLQSLQEHGDALVRGRPPLLTQEERDDGVIDVVSIELLQVLRAKPCHLIR
jgi:hypothetical protein